MLREPMRLPRWCKSPDANALASPSRLDNEENLSVSGKGCERGITGGAQVFPLTLGEASSPYISCGIRY
jgi:hypothetical protein